MADNKGIEASPIDQVGSVTGTDEVVATTDAVAAAIFGISLKTEFSARVAMEVNAFLNSQGAENYSLGRGGAIKTAGGVSEEDSDEKKRLNDFARGLDLLADLEEQRARWAATESTLGGVTMSGANWSLLSERLSRDTEDRKLLLAQMMADGYSEVDANRMVDEIALAAKGQSMPQPDRTPQMNRVIDKLNQDPALTHYLALAEQNRKDLEKPEIENAGLAGKKSINASEGELSAKLNLSAHHVKSLAATSPLDAAKLAANIPPPTNSTGLDF